MNPNRIVSPVRTAAVGHDQHGWPATEADIKELFGLSRKAKWPQSGLDDREIQGVRVWVNPMPSWYVKGETRKLSTHRARCQCPQCGWQGSVGRLAQHVCKLQHVYPPTIPPASAAKVRREVRAIGPRHDPYHRETVTISNSSSGCVVTVIEDSLRDRTTVQFYVNKKLMRAMTLGGEMARRKASLLSRRFVGVTLDEATMLANEQSRRLSEDPMGHPSRYI